MELLAQVNSQLRDLYRSMTPGSRLTAVVAAAVVLSSLGYLGAPRTAAPDADLMHGVPLAAAQLPGMEAAFAKANLTGYEIRGTSILVPRGQEPLYMKALADANALPPKPGAFESQAGSAASPFESGAQLELRMKIAKQNELSLAIAGMPGVEWASVLYDIDNKPRGFGEKLITATVSVKPFGANRLEACRVSDIRHLVAGAIAGLKPESVTVSDLNGRTWHGDCQDHPSAGPSTGPAATSGLASGTIQPVPTPAPAAQPTSDATSTSLETPAESKETPWTALGRELATWAMQSWRALGSAAAAVVGLLVFWRMVRVRPAPAESTKPAPVKSENAEVVAKSAVGKPAAAVPPPHWNRRAAATPVAREELSALVESDPDTAAKILRAWIGQTN